MEERISSSTWMRTSSHPGFAAVSLRDVAIARVRIGICTSLFSKSVTD